MGYSQPLVESHQTACPNPIGQDYHSQGYFLGAVTT